MSNINDLISALSGQDMVQANNVFGSLMQDKINDALDDRKVQIAQSMMGINPDEEFEDEEEYEEVEEDDELQDVSDESDGED